MRPAIRPAALRRGCSVSTPTTAPRARNVENATAAMCAVENARERCAGPVCVTVEQHVAELCRCVVRTSVRDARKTGIRENPHPPDGAVCVLRVERKTHAVCVQSMFGQIIFYASWLSAWVFPALIRGKRYAASPPVGRGANNRRFPRFLHFHLPVWKNM